MTPLAKPLKPIIIKYLSIIYILHAYNMAIIFSFPFAFISTLQLFPSLSVAPPLIISLEVFLYCPCPQT